MRVMREVELRKVKVFEIFRLTPNSPNVYLRGQYDKATRQFYARQLGDQSSVYKFDPTATVYLRSTK